MRDSCKRNVLGIMMDAVDYQMALTVFEAVEEKRIAISALACTADRHHQLRTEVPPQPL